MKFLSLIFLILTSFSYCVTPQAPKRLLQSRFIVEKAEIEELEHKGQCSKAVIKIEKAIGVNQKDVWLYSIMGRCHLDMKRFGDAFSDFRTCYSIDENNPLCYRGFGEYYYKLKYYKIANEFYKKALKVSKDPNFNAQVHDALAHSFYNLKDYENAMTNSKKSTEIEDVGDYYGIQGLIHYSKGNLEEALNLWRTALESKKFRYLSSKAWVHYGVAKYYSDKENLPAAMGNIFKSFELEPAEPEFLKLYDELSKK